MLRIISNSRPLQFAFVLFLLGSIMMFQSCTKDSDISDLESSETSTDQRTNLVYPDMQNGILMFSDDAEYDAYLDQVMDMSTTELESFYDELGFVPIEVSYDEYFETIGYQVYEGGEEGEESVSEVKNLFPFPNDPLLKKVANEYGEFGIGNSLYRYLTKRHVNINNVENMDEFISMRESNKMVSANSKTIDEVKGDTIILGNRSECELLSGFRLKGTSPGNLRVTGLAHIIDEDGEFVMCDGVLSIVGEDINEQITVTSSNYFMFWNIPHLYIDEFDFGGDANEDRDIVVTFTADASCECDNVLTENETIKAIGCVKDDDSELRQTYVLENPDGSVIRTYMLLSFNTNAQIWRRSHVTTEMKCRKLSSIGIPHGPDVGTKWNIRDCTFVWFGRIYKEDNCTELKEHLPITEKEKFEDWKMQHSIKRYSDFRGNVTDLPDAKAILTLHAETGLHSAIMNEECLWE